MTTKDKLAFALGLCSVGAYAQKEWETLWEGTLGASGAVSDHYGIPNSVLKDYFGVGDIVRFTFNGESVVQTARAWTGNNSIPCIGNECLNSDSLPDTGEDFFLMGGVIWSVYFRTPGTYTVKIERKV